MSERNVKKFVAMMVVGCFLLVGGKQTFANKFQLTDGRVLEGTMALLTRVDERSNVSDYESKPVVLISDELRYVYLSKSRIRQVIPEQPLRLETFRTGERPNYDGKEYNVPGTYVNSTPFDEFGRRLMPVHHSGGVEWVEQAITEINPYYIRVTGLRENNRPLKWDMRLATNAVPREQLTPILVRLLDNPENIEERLRLVRFYYGAKLYIYADAELESIMEDWKDSPEVQQRYRPLFQNIRQDFYLQILDELDLRWDSGQYRFVQKYLAMLEQDAKLPEGLFERVRRMIHRFDETEQECQSIVAALKNLYEQLPENQKSVKIPEIISEIEQGLNFTTLRRFSTFRLYANDQQLSAAERLAFGITGWYAGANASNSQLSLAITFPETEQLIGDYLRSGNNHVQRQQILEKLKNLETARPDLIAAILATMNPPLSSSPLWNSPPELPDEPAGESATEPGYYHFSIPNPLVTAGVPIAGVAPAIRYAVQLPPDYNPSLRYPMVVSLNGAAQTPDMQIDWWAGSWREGERRGHATRYGYIVLAPDWNPSNDANYDFSIHSHSAVLACVRDAFRRFSVDTDKVFLSGHGTGGTAAWDIALAHPDIWAGAIPFNAVADKYIVDYREAVRYVPFYFVWGEMEGVGSSRKWLVNAPTMNRYLQTQRRPADVTAVRYIGRGMEGFSEEIIHILEWMNLKRRYTIPQYNEFTVETLRPWDSFFWWVEMPNLHMDAARNMIDPVDFPARQADRRPVKVESTLFRSTNTVTVRVPRGVQVRMCLTPELLDFGTRATVRVNDKNFHPPNGILEPDIEVMLNDVRTRADRQHPFWAVLDGK